MGGNMTPNSTSGSNNGWKHSDPSVVQETAGDSGKYKVGPGRPPKEHQFKPGQSGNPKGAKPKPRSILLDFKKLFDDALNRKVTLANAEKKTALTKFEIGMEQLANQFAKGDRHARHEVFALADKLGIDLVAEQKNALENTVAADHQAILDAYVERQYDKVVQREAEMAPPELLDDDVDDQNGR
jgi:hypothetical protein